MSANLNYWTAPHNSDNGFPDSNGRRDERREMGWLSGTELRYRALSHVESFCWMCRHGTCPTSGIYQVSEPLLLSFHYHTYTRSQTHTHTHALPLANSLKRVTFVLQLPVKRGEHCLQVNKVKFTEQVNIRKHRFHFQSTFYVHPTCSSLPEVTVLELDDWCCDHRWESRNRVVCNLITAHYNTVCSKQSRLTVYSIEVWC